VVHDNAALGELLLNVVVRQAVAQYHHTATAITSRADR
jgi:hypothetical protein